MRPADDPGAALYVHWPFCRAKCPYCDFNSHVRPEIDEDRWAGALEAELRHAAPFLRGRPLASIFFGGGTPSLMAPRTVARVIDGAARLLDFDPAIEITLEANPTSVEAGRFAGYALAGVGRVSLGVQSLDDAALRFLGREHDAAQALEAVALARRHFPRVSFDLIYARPGQSPASWEAELRRALDESAGHLSLYQLTIEPGTRFHALQRDGRLVMPGEEAEADLYALTDALLASSGYDAYEVSNYARPGEECRHNLVYWRYGDYAGIGPGAHGRLTLEGGSRVATQTRRAPEAWLKAVEAHGHGELPRETLSQDDQLAERLLMGLRLKEGVPLSRIESATGAPWRSALDADALRRFGGEGFVAVDAGRLRATQEGRLRLDRLVPALLP
ncbi:MAG: coproporphyrinogen III oxidase [Geminicoccaceae bacterium]|nr:coproporphyrinogen III oxidase [Geminicoccaceae bacterium]